MNAYVDLAMVHLIAVYYILEVSIVTGQDQNGSYGYATAVAKERSNRLLLGRFGPFQHRRANEPYLQNYSYCSWVALIYLNNR